MLHHENKVLVKDFLIRETLFQAETNQEVSNSYLLDRN